MPRGLESLIQSGGQPVSAMGVDEGGTQFASGSLPSIPLTDRLRVLPAVEEYLRLPKTEWMPNGAYSVTPSAALQYDVPLGANGLLQLGAGMQQNFNNMPGQDARREYFGGANYSTTFDSNPYVDAVLSYLKR